MYPQIILLGDSLIQRCFDPETPAFGPALANAYFRRADVMNRGFGGYNTEWLLPVLENQILPSVVDVVLWIILIGANDAMLAPGPNHVPLAQYRINLQKIINAIERHHKLLNTTPRIILFTPPPVREDLINEHLPHQSSVRSREAAYQYAQTLMSLDVPPFVEKANIHEAIELAPAQAYLKDPKLIAQTDPSALRFEDGGLVMSLSNYLSDGLHLKNPSYQIIYDLATKIIREKWPEITPENMRMPVRWWGDILAQKTQELRDEL